MIRGAWQGIPHKKYFHSFGNYDLSDDHVPGDVLANEYRVLKHKISKNTVTK